MNEIKSKQFLKKFLKFTNNSFGMVITLKTRNIRSLFPLKDKNDYKWCVINKVIVLVVHVTLVKQNVMQKLDGRNIIIQLKVQNHQNTLEATSTPFLHGLSFQMLKKKKKKKTRKNLEASYISLWKPNLKEQKDFERLVFFRNGVI